MTEDRITKDGMTVVAKPTDLLKNLKKVSDPTRAKHHQTFFRTARGAYGAGDIFWGIKVPVLRQLSRQYRSLSLDELDKLIDHEIHEVRQTALFIMVLKFEKEPTKDIFDLYLKKAWQGRVNNWDLVDCSAHQIIGGWLTDKNRKLVIDLAKSGDLWLQRIAMLSTYHWIKQGDFKDALKVSEILLNHQHDLIHKAVGWMLREIGNRDLETEEDFLKLRYNKMPRTMLRYAIEKFPADKRNKYLKGKI